MLRSASDSYNMACCYDSKQLRKYLEKVKAFYTRFESPKLREFVEGSFNKEFWISVEYAERELSAYNKYSNKVKIQEH